MDSSSADVGRPVFGVMDHRALFGHIEKDLRARGTVMVGPDQPDQYALMDGALAYPDRPLTAEILAASDRLVVVTQLGTAIHADVEAATELGIVVLNNTGPAALSVAEHTMGLMLALVKRIPQSDRYVRTRQPWDVGTPDLFMHELHGKTLGLLGFGNIGRLVAHMASVGFGMKVVVFEQNLAPVIAAGYEHADIDEVLRQADFVSVHLPLLPATTNMVDKARFAQMKPTALLVNTSRAEVVDYDALYEALRDGVIAGAAFDTWPHHRANLDSPLIDLENVVMTQHNAGLTHESTERMGEYVVSGLCEVLAGQSPTQSTVVNPEVWDRRRSYAGPALPWLA